MRRTLRWIVPSTARFGFLLRLGRAVRPLLPQSLRRHIPAAKPAGAWPQVRHARRVLIPAGCVQPMLEPGIDSALARLMDQHADPKTMTVSQGQMLSAFLNGSMAAFAATKFAIVPVPV